MTVRQPHAFLIAHRGKDRENRTWGTKYRGELYIHAGLYRPEPDEIILENQWLKRRGLPAITDTDREQFDYGKLVAVTNLVDIAHYVRGKSSKWHEPDAFGWVLENTVKLDPPIPFRGKQGIFEATL